MPYPWRFPDKTRLGPGVLAIRVCLAIFCALGLWAGAVAADPFARLDAAVANADGPSALTAALVARGDARRVEGLLGEALEDLSRAADTAPTEPERAYADAALGLALAEAGRRGAAADRLRAALDGAAGQPAVIAIAAAKLAFLEATDDRVETSSMKAARLDGAAALARRAAASAVGLDAVLGAIVDADRARVALTLGDRPEAAAILAEALDRVTATGGGGAGQALLALGKAGLEAEQAPLAARAFAAAAQGGGRIGAEGALGAGEAALLAGDYGGADASASRAGLIAARIGAEDIQFRADWLAAEALSRLDRRPAARAAYDRAFAGLRDYRARLPLGAPPAAVGRGAGGRAFQLDYIDFLFRGARDAASLIAARDLVEDLKLDEIDDYFAERCTPARGRARAADDLGGGALVLYPIVFSDRTEMIWSRAGQIGGYTIDVTEGDLRAQIAALRYQIDFRIGGVEGPAGALYDLLLAPIADELFAADTLVIAPDGPLRALPFAALWTGETWLGGRVGLATVLSLNLVDQGLPGFQNAEVLAAGAEEVDPEYAPLPSVPLELAAIAEAFGATVLAEEDFLAPALAGEVSRRPYDIVHIATHAEFGATPAENFILTSDGRLDVTQLEATLRARAVQTNAPVSLLTLSACNTAADIGGEAAEKAPLGLAGVGFRAGARSVLASLWPAEDVSTAELMRLFYRALSEGAGRAEALRRAQAALISDPETADPFQWANFLLIGDWR